MIFLIFKLCFFHLILLQSLLRGVRQAASVDGGWQAAELWGLSLSAATAALFVFLLMLLGKIEYG